MDTYSCSTKRAGHVLGIGACCLALAFVACRKESGDSPSKRSVSTKSEKLPVIAPLSMGPLIVEPVRAVIEKLERAHYDPGSLGLESLAFSIELVETKNEVLAKGEGRWRKGSFPEVELGSFRRKGKESSAPKDAGLQKEIWSAVKEQIEFLLEGLGQGFLTKRFEMWSKMQGKATLKGDRLLLELSDDQGTYQAIIKEGYVVEQITHHSTQGINRKMSYSDLMEGGRNLVQRAVLAVTIDEGASLPDKDNILARENDGLTFEMRYQKIGAFWLPVSLRKLARGGDEVRLSLSYRSALP
jgi:hypothetical protein